MIDDNGVLTVDDNDNRTASIVFEIPLKKLFGYGKYRQEKEEEIKKERAAAIDEYRTKLVDTYLTFKNHSENLHNGVIEGSQRVYYGESKELIALRSSAVIYYFNSNSRQECLKSWLFSSLK